LPVKTYVKPSHLFHTLGVDLKFSIRLMVESQRSYAVLAANASLFFYIGSSVFEIP